MKTLYIVMCCLSKSQRQPMCRKVFSKMSFGFVVVVCDERTCHECNSIVGRWRFCISESCTLSSKSISSYPSQCGDCFVICFSLQTLRLLDAPILTLILDPNGLLGLRCNRIDVIVCMFFKESAGAIVRIARPERR